jgi:hypothetical protein
VVKASIPRGRDANGLPNCSRPPKSGRLSLTSTKPVGRDGQACRVQVKDLVSERGNAHLRGSSE